MIREYRRKRGDARQEEEERWREWAERGRRQTRGTREGEEVTVNGEEL
jgi:hypothetical protein